MQVLAIVGNFIKSKELTKSHDVAGIIIESALLPLLENAFRSSSLLEMAKQHTLYKAYLDVVTTFAADLNLVTCLLPVNDYFFEESLDPPQREPLHQLLEQHGETAGIFLSALENEGSGRNQDPAPYELAEQLKETNETVIEAIKRARTEKGKRQVSNILARPVREQYELLLAAKRFDYMDMREEGGAYKHIFQLNATNCQNPTPQKLVRLAQEMADLAS